MLPSWLQIGAGTLLILVLGTLLKCVSDLGQIKGTVSTLVGRVDGMESRLARIENLLMGRPPGSDAPRKSA